MSIKESIYHPFILPENISFGGKNTESKIENEIRNMQK